MDSDFAVSTRIPELPPCSCPNPSCASSRGHKCVCRTYSLCHASNDRHECICDTRQNVKLCIAKEHKCSCEIASAWCKRRDGRHDCGCVDDPLACTASHHRCVCIMQQYDGWQRVCRATPSTAHDCVCRNPQLVCRAYGPDGQHEPPRELPRIMQQRQHPGFQFAM